VPQPTDPSFYIAPELEGVRLKLSRAVDQFHDLDVAVDELFRLNSKQAGHEFDDKGDIIIKLSYQPPLDPRFALVVGDCIHNTRSALDHLVAQLAILNSAPAKAIEKTAFPVCLTNEQFKEQTRRKVAPYITREAFTEIESLQPYKTGDKEKDILWILSQLDIIDKHRVLIVAKHKIRVVSMKAVLGDKELFSGNLNNDAPWKSAENGAEIIRLRLTPNPPSPMKMHVEMGTEGTIQIEKTGLCCDGQNLGVVLRDCINYVSRIIDHFGHKFFGEKIIA
jgi:hypothetical protein